MTELEKLRACLEYDLTSAEIIALKIQAITLCQKLNATYCTETTARREILRELFGSVGKNPVIYPGFNCDFLKNISVGDNFFVHNNVTILGGGKVTIGNNVEIMPYSFITTTKLSTSPKKRREHLALESPVTIGNDVWIGSRVTIFPGVTIGNNVLITLGTVVTQDVPDNSLVGGVPAKVLKTLVDDTEA